MKKNSEMWRDRMRRRMREIEKFINSLETEEIVYMTKYANAVQLDRIEESARIQNSEEQENE